MHNWKKGDLVQISNPQSPFHKKIGKVVTKGDGGLFIKLNGQRIPIYFPWGYDIPRYTEEELRAQDDGRVLSLFKMKNGTYAVIFNLYPYTSKKITEEEFEAFPKDDMTLEEGCDSVEIYYQTKNI